MGHISVRNHYSINLFLIMVVIIFQEVNLSQRGKTPNNNTFSALHSHSPMYISIELLDRSKERYMKRNVLFSWIMNLI